VAGWFPLLNFCVANAFAAATSRSQSGGVRAQRSRNTDNAEALFGEGKREERIMPILVMWAVPAVIVIGGVGYWLVHMH